MIKNILNLFAVLAFTGMLSACGQNADQAAPADAPAAPAEAPAAPAAPAGH